LKDEINRRSRLCKHLEEAIDNLTSGCPILAMNEYVMRYDKVCIHLHSSTCKGLGTETTGRRCPHPLKPMYEQEDVTVLWNQGIQTEREFAANTPDVIINTKKIKQAY
jgi:hypothetical protein